MSDLVGKRKEYAEEYFNKDYLNECFTYDNGKLFWRLDRPKDHFTKDGYYNLYLKRYAGKEAFTSINKNNGYHQSFFKGQLTLRRLVIFIMFKGYVPSRSIKSKLPDSRSVDFIEILYECDTKPQKSQKKKNNGTI